MFTALGWVLLSLVSLSVGAVAVLTTLALGKQAHPDAGALALWALALSLTFGVPFALAAWKHHAEPRRISQAMAWIPTVWNALDLAMLTLLVPDVTANALRGVEWVVQGQLGDAHPRDRRSTGCLL